MQVGGWLRADGSKWVKVRNEKRKLEGAVKMAAWQELLAGKRAAREAVGTVCAGGRVGRRASSNEWVG